MLRVSDVVEFQAAWSQEVREGTYSMALILDHLRSSVEAWDYFVRIRSPIFQQVSEATNAIRSFIYKIFKLGFTLWLIHPEYQGAMYIYIRISDEFFEQEREKLLSSLHRAVGTITKVSQKFLQRLSQTSGSNKTKNGLAPVVAEVELTSQAWLQKKLMAKFKNLETQ